MSLIQTTIPNKEVRDAFILSCYQGLRWCDVKELYWDQIQEKKLVTTIIQKKTGRPVELTLHPVSQNILANCRLQFELLKKKLKSLKKNGGFRFLICRRKQTIVFAESIIIKWPWNVTRPDNIPSVVFSMVSVCVDIIKMLDRDSLP